MNRSLISVARQVIWRRAGVSPGRSQFAISAQLSSPARVPCPAATSIRRPPGAGVIASRAPVSGSPAARSPEYGASWRDTDSSAWPLSMAPIRSANTNRGSLLRPRKMSSALSGVPVLPGCGRAAGQSHAAGAVFPPRRG